METTGTPRQRTRKEVSPQHGGQHRLKTLKRAVRELGARTLDRRTKVGRALGMWRAQLVADLGGEEALSTQQHAIIDLAVRTKLLLDSIDSWLLVQSSLINKRKRALLPVVRERIQLADALVRYLAALGLERRTAPTRSLQEYLENRSSTVVALGNESRS